MNEMLIRKFKITIIFMLLISYNALANSDKVFDNQNKKDSLQVKKGFVEYFLLDENNSAYKIVEVGLDASKVYNYPIKIRLYNIHLDAGSVVLFSTFQYPDQNNLKEVDIKTLPGSVIELPALKKQFEEGLSIYRKSNGYDVEHIKRQDIGLIIKKGNKYFAYENSLAEYFKIVETPLVFPNLMGNVFINIKSPQLSIKEFEEKYKVLNKSYSVNSLAAKNTAGTTALSRPLEKPLLFCSDSLKILGYEAYKFWQFTDWPTIDDNNNKRGIDRFIFIPKIGIVGGSFDSWFLSYVSPEVMQKNYINEAIILPDNEKDVVIY